MILILLLFPVAGLFAQGGDGQKEKDSLVTLLTAEYARQFEHNAMDFRMVKGPAVFLHNGAYMHCDSAIWNLSQNIIKAYDNVRIIQDQTVLTSDSLTYIVDLDLAQFRGSLVQLVDKDTNILRSNNLDYNTKDSLATFHLGGAVMGKDGNVMEGENGSYDIKLSTFTFYDNVHLFTDSLFIKTTHMLYLQDSNRTHFGVNTNIWKDNYYMRADNGWYDNENEVVHFFDNSYLNNPDYESWADSLYFYRKENRSVLIKNVQLLDTIHKVNLLSHRANIVGDTIGNVNATLTVEPAMAFYGENENSVKDSLFVKADTLYFYTQRRCDIPQAQIDSALKFKSDIFFDAIAEADKKAAEERAKREAEAYAKSPEGIAEQRRKKLEQERMAKDSLNKKPVVDTMTKEQESVLSGVDSLAVEVAPDTSKLIFIEAFRDVVLYRSDTQGRCDSLSFSQIDSLSKLYYNPVLWNKVNNQITSTKMYLMMNETSIDRGFMQDEAMVVSKQANSYFNQIKSAEMIGYFRGSELTRYDALGGVVAKFFLEEDDKITTLNTKEARFMMVQFDSSEVKRIKYYENLLNDAHPVAGLSMDLQRVKGFSWIDTLRPVDRFQITKRSLRTSDRLKYVQSRPHFPYTNRYFQEYMTDIYRQIADREYQAGIDKLRRDSIQRADKDWALIMKDMEAFADLLSEDLDKQLQDIYVPVERLPWEAKIEIPEDIVEEEIMTSSQQRKEVRIKKRTRRKLNKLIKTLSD